MNTKREDENGQKQKKKKIGIIAAVLLGVYVLVMLLMLFLFGGSSGKRAKSKTVKKETETQTQKSERKHVSTSKEELQDNTVTYDDGDYVYTPSDDHIFFDDTDHMIYYDNLITVYLDEKISDKEKEKIKKKIDGESIGSDLSGTLNVLDIVVASSDYAKLQQKAEEAAKLDGVQYAMISFPVMPEEDTAAYWDGDGDLKNEASPSGADWWAEAIGAYSAWKFERYCNPIVVGVMDNGFELSHTDLQRNGQSVLKVLNNNSVEEHGTHVAGLIAAQDNDMGSRGVIPSADVVCIDWAQEAEDGTEFDLLTPTAVGQSFKMMIEYAERKQLPIVINNSWGSYLGIWQLIGKRLDYDLIQKRDFYERYGSEYSLYTSVCAAQLVDELLKNSKVDFLIVQSSGNGYENGLVAYNVKRAGWFGGIDEDVKKRCSMLSYDLVKKHIIIVGAVQEKKKNGKYKLCFTSNYGANVDIVAPGEHVYSTVLNNGFAYKDGTSMAAPIVSGSAAYIWSLNPSMSAADVKQRLIDTAEVAVKNIKEDKRSEYPMLNLGSAATSTIMGTVSGTIKDQDGKAITGVLCKRTCEISDQQVFNMDLNFSDSTFTVSAIGRMRLTFQKEGYETNTATVNVLPGQDLDLGTIVMQSDEPETESPDLEIEETETQVSEIKVPDTEESEKDETEAQEFDPDIWMPDVEDETITFEGHEYQFFDFPDVITSWEAAKKYCESLGGHLAIISSQEENDFLYQAMTEQHYRNAYFGITDEENEGVWKCVDGSDPVYTNWHEGEPNQENENEDYGMFYWKYDDGTWNDGDFGGYTNQGETVFICEWD